MIVLGVDPGTATTGFGVVRESSGRLEALAAGVIETDAALSLASRLGEIARGVEALVARYGPDCLAVEEIFFNRNVRSALAVGHARGVVLLAADRAGLEVVALSPLEVKTAVTGYGRADKVQVQKMVQRLLGLTEPPRPADAADALAVAIACLHRRPLAARLRETSGSGRPAARPAGRRGRG